MVPNLPVIAAFELRALMCWPEPSARRGLGPVWSRTSVVDCLLREDLERGGRIKYTNQQY
eukprot:5479052-Heterocapsa_arctica.AAC.1